jgi:hypothetical protein
VRIVYSMHINTIYGQIAAVVTLNPAVRMLTTRVQNVNHLVFVIKRLWVFCELRY